MIQQTYFLRFFVSLSLSLSYRVLVCVVLMLQFRKLTSEEAWEKSPEKIAAIAQCAKLLARAHHFKVGTVLCKCGSLVVLPRTVYLGYFQRRNNMCYYFRVLKLGTVVDPSYRG